VLICFAPYLSARTGVLTSLDSVCWHQYGSAFVLHQEDHKFRRFGAKFIASVSSHFWAGVTLEWTEANGQSSVLILRDGTPVVLATIDASAQGIDQILWIMRPSKLAAVARPGPTPGA